MARVAVITNSASDLDPAEAAEAGVSVVPLIVTFGPDSYRAGVEMSTEAFWERMTAPDAPFPTTAASSPGDFRDAYEAAFADGAEAIISIHVAGTLSGTIKSAQIAREMLAGSRDPHRRLAGRLEGAGDPRPDGRGDGGGRHRPGRDRRVPLAPRVGPADVRRARDARIPQARRPDQRRPGRDRHAALGQADHRGRGGRGRHRGPRSDACQGPGASHRADHRAADRAARDPPHASHRTSSSSGRR